MNKSRKIVKNHNKKLSEDVFPEFFKNINNILDNTAPRFNFILY